MTGDEKCPICNGRGEVPAGFYSGAPSPDGRRETCRTCGGSGLVVAEAADQGDAVGSPVDLTFRG